MLWCQFGREGCKWIFILFSGSCIVRWAFPSCGEDLMGLPDFRETLGGWKLDNFFLYMQLKVSQGPQVWLM